MPPAFSILIVMGNLCNKSLLEIPLFFWPLSLYVSARYWYLTFLNSWNTVLSSQDTVSSTITTYFGYTDYRSISGQRFERVTFLRKFYVRSYASFASSWIRLTDWNLLRCCFCIFLSQKANEFPPSLSRYVFSFSITYLCIVIVIEQPMCQIRKKGQQVVHGRKKKVQLKRLLFRPHVSE